RAKPQLGVLRLFSAAIKQQEIDERIELNDQRVLATLDKMVKQRRESIRQFTDASRMGLVEQEEFEISVLKVYLPEPLNEAEIAAMIDQAVVDSGAQGVADMGKVMGLIKPQAQGRADMGAVSKLVKAKLA
ncbi:MAG: GatB/YqeY domain-containing protein, partial [Immundisolibacteraceae bacterium]|nr:GatB/YqeY domain-containing protein [Immundisolibacteraceae bacterium]